MDVPHAARIPGPSFDAHRGATPGPGGVPFEILLAAGTDPTPLERTTGLGIADAEGWQEVPRYTHA